MAIAVQSIERRDVLKDVRRLVLKLGTRVVTVHDNELDGAFIERIAGKVRELVDGAEDPRQVLRDFTGASLSRPGSSVDEQK